jgi:hypothetical protein
MPVAPEWFEKLHTVRLKKTVKRLSLLAILVLCVWPETTDADSRLN